KGALITTSASYGFELATNANLEIKGEGTLASKATKSGDSLIHLTKKSTLTVSGVTLDVSKAYWAYGVALYKGSEGSIVNISNSSILGKGGLSVNGSVTDNPSSEITLDGVTIEDVNSTLCSTGIYQAGPSIITVKNSTINAKDCGIETRAGTLNIEDNTEIIVTNSGAPQVRQSANGATTLNAGIAIAPHTTEKEITVDIKSGKIEGPAGLVMTNPQESASKVTLTVASVVELVSNNAKFKDTPVVYTEDFVDTISNSGLMAGVQEVKFGTQDGAFSSLASVDKTPLAVEYISLVPGPYTLSDKLNRPKVTVQIDENSDPLTIDKDYKVSYQECDDLGDAFVVVTGIGEYTGIVYKTYVVIDDTGNVVNIVFGNLDEGVTETSVDILHKYFEDENGNSLEITNENIGVALTAQSADPEASESDYAPQYTYT
ncbi:MAG: hypothetical protein K2H85_01395, partial [Allobaculum sp.]|nr:hypothetical protein [Allobaculum sp.]